MTRIQAVSEEINIYLLLYPSPQDIQPGAGTGVLMCSFDLFIDGRYIDLNPILGGDIESRGSFAWHSSPVAPGCFQFNDEFMTVIQSFLVHEESMSEGQKWAVMEFLMATHGYDRHDPSFGSSCVVASSLNSWTVFDYFELSSSGSTMVIQEHFYDSQGRGNGILGEVRKHKNSLSWYKQDREGVWYDMGTIKPSELGFEVGIVPIEETLNKYFDGEGVVATDFVPTSLENCQRLF